MSRRKPVCARCGKPFGRKGGVFMSFGRIPGRPEIAFHIGESGDCFDQEVAEQDSILHLSKWASQREEVVDRTTVIDRLRLIEQRGPGRLVANRAWSDHMSGRAAS